MFVVVYCGNDAIACHPLERCGNHEDTGKLIRGSASFRNVLLVDRMRPTHKANLRTLPEFLKTRSCATKTKRGRFKLP